MASFKPFSYLCRWLVSDRQAVTAEQRWQNLALWQIVLIGLVGIEATLVYIGGRYYGLHWIVAVVFHQRALRGSNLNEYSVKLTRLRLRNTAECSASW